MSSFGPQSFLTPPISHPYVPAGPHARFSRMELQHLAIAFSVLTAAFFAIWLRDAYFSTDLGTAYYEIALAAAALTAGTGFVAHEMAHKFAAQARGLWAEFRMSPQGLLFTLIFAVVIGFLFAAPGATMIGGRGTVEEAGVTSLAGPATNITESAAISLSLSAVLYVHHAFANTIWTPVLAYVAFLNLVFAIFNLIPWGPLDGAKIWRWSKGVWVGSLSIAVVLAVAVAIFLYLPYFV